MRLFKQREGKPEEAVRYGVLSHLCRCVAYFKFIESHELKFKKPNNTLNEYLETHISRQFIESTLNPLLKKAKKESHLNELASLVEDYTKELSNIDLALVRCQAYFGGSFWLSF